MPRYSRSDRRARAAIAAAVALGTIAAQPAAAQDYPSRPVRFLCGFAPGGSSDLVSRALGQKLAERLGQPFVIENKVGASGVAANDTVAKAAPDGHHLILLTGGHPVAAVLMRRLPYDPLRDFGMVSTVISYPMVISVAQHSPVTTLPALIAKARAEPGRVTYAISGPGSLHHLLGELVGIESGTVMTGVPFKGASQAIVDLVGNRIDAMVETATASFPHIRGGKLRALALSSGTRYPLMPDVPTIAETLPGVEVSSWLGLATSPGTPRAIVDRLNQEVRAIVELPDVRQRFADLGGVPMPSSPAEMRGRIEREIVRWRRVVELKNIERQ